MLADQPAKELAIRSLSRDFSPGPEGRGFSPAASRRLRLSASLAARTVRRLTDCAGRETERVGEAAATAGLKPRPSAPSNSKP